MGKHALNASNSPFSLAFCQYSDFICKWPKSLTPICRELRVGICYTFDTVKRRRTKEEKPEIFKSIRKPTAPASRKLGPEKSGDKLDPVGRRSKHKKKQETDADI